MKETGPVAEAPEESALAHAGFTCEAVHRDRVGAPFAKQPLGRAHDRRTIARRVCALTALALHQREFDRLAHSRIVEGAVREGANTDHSPLMLEYPPVADCGPD